MIGLFLRAGDPDALFALFDSSNVGSNFNFSCVKDPELDRMLAQGRQESDPARRKAIYVDIEKRVLDQALMVPLVDQLSVWALRSNVSGLKFSGYTYPLITELVVQR